jgi:hypothetical protein
MEDTCTAADCAKLILAGPLLESGAIMSVSRVLLVCDTVDLTPASIAALRDRASRGPIAVHVLVANPSAAEWHPLHPNRHVKVDEAREALSRTLPAISKELDVPVTGSVANDHDPFDAIEHLIREHEADEVLVSTQTHPLAHRLHLDLAHRVAHLHVPVSDVAAAETGESSSAR